MSAQANPSRNTALLIAAALVTVWGIAGTIGAGHGWSNGPRNGGTSSRGAGRTRLRRLRPQPLRHLMTSQCAP